MLIVDMGRMVWQFSEGFIPIELPQGSTVIEMRLSIYDLLASENITVQLLRKHYSSANPPEIISSWTSSGTPEIQFITVNVNHVIAGDYCYWFRVSCSAISTGLGFYGAMIQYTVTQSD